MRVRGRPSLGSLFGAALGAWAAVLVVEELSWASYAGSLQGPSLPQVLVVCALAAASLFIRHRRRRSCSQGAGKKEGGGVRALVRAALIVAVSSCAAALCAGLHWASWAQDVRDAPDLLAGSALACDLTSDASMRDYGYVSTARTRGEGRTVELRILWPEDAQPVSAGHRVLVQGSLSVPKADEGGRWNHRQGYVGMLAARVIEPAGYATGLAGFIAPFRDACFDRIQQYAGQGAGLLAGVLIGNETLYEGSELERDFQTTGLAHLMAVSGSHLVVVMVLLGWLLGKAPLHRALRSFAICACLVLYVALTCMAPSAIRSCVMCIVAECAGLSQRRAHVPSALALCVLAFSCLSPSIVFSVGFQLSVLAVAGLMLFSPLVQSWLEWALPAKARPLAEVIAATVCATVTTLPVTVPLFAQFPVISPLSNLIAGPLVSAILGLGIPALLIGAVLPDLGGLLLALDGALGNLCAALVHVLADLPGACVPLDADAGVLGAVSALGLVVLWAAWPAPPQAGAFGSSAGPAPSPKPGPAHRHALFKRLGLFAACLGAPCALMLVCGFGGVSGAVNALDPRSRSAEQVVMIDVGQGDCMLIRDGDAAVLVDTGADDLLLVQGLARHGVTHLDAIIVTHKDADHCGALSALAGVVGVEHVYVHEDLVDDPIMDDVADDARQVSAAGKLEGVGVGTRVAIGEFSLTVLAPADGGESENEDSLVCLLEYDAQGDGVAEARGLLTGDAEAEATEEVTQTVGDVDFLKVAHHGSRGAETAEELAILKPQVALIGVGADNSYGHPTREMLELLAQCHAKVYRTDVNGDITLDFSAEAMSVSVQKQ